MADLQLEIVTPDRKILSQAVADVTLPGPQGELGILPDHAPLTAMLSTGLVVYRSEGTMQKLAVRGGFLQVGENRVTLLPDQAVRSTEVLRPALEKEAHEIDAKLVDAAVGIEERDKLTDTRRWIQARLDL